MSTKRTRSRRGVKLPLSVTLLFGIGCGWNGRSAAEIQYLWEIHGHEFLKQWRAFHKRTPWVFRIARNEGWPIDTTWEGAD